MNDRLPNIQIKVNTDLSEFLEQLQKVALEAKNYQVEFHRDFLGQGYDILEVAPKVSMSHIGLLGQFIVGTDKKRNVSVEIKANRWKPEPPTYEMYVKAAKEIVVPY